MPPRRKSSAARRRPLSRERVLAAAARLADARGLDALTMRALGQELGVEAMSLYHHVAGKEALLDGLVEVALAEIEVPERGEAWRPAMRRRAESAREVLGRHPWATSLLESRRSAGPASLRYYDAVIGCLREAGFSITLAAHAFSALDSYVYGFCLQEQKLPFESGEELEELAQEILTELPEGEYPYFEEMVTEHMLAPGYDFAREFGWGLELVLDGLEARLAEESG